MVLSLQTFTQPPCAHLREPLAFSAYARKQPLLKYRLVASDPPDDPPVAAIGHKGCQLFVAPSCCGQESVMPCTRLPCQGQLGHAITRIIEQQPHSSPEPAGLAAPQCATSIPATSVAVASLSPNTPLVMSIAFSTVRPRLAPFDCWPVEDCLGAGPRPLAAIDAPIDATSACPEFIFLLSRSVTRKQCAFSDV
eukprot:m.302407 g.302407  ORF g.302407 m.302407 type:complete len:194 (-) comp15168_c0_seq1:208-789(-)